MLFLIQFITVAVLIFNTLHISLMPLPFKVIGIIYFSLLVCMISINIKIVSSDFSAKLYDNITVRELIKEFPVTYNMSELHGNEKYYYMSDSLPTDSKVLDNINKGEIMLYGSDCLVVFYDTFPNSYSYTRLGYIEDTSGLENALGIGNVDISLNCSKKISSGKTHLVFF